MVFMFYGNGGNHGHRIPLGKIFFGKMRCNVIMLSFRARALSLRFHFCPTPLTLFCSYGHPEGTPSEKGA